ncbi:MAG: hypothetical protein ACI9EW_000771 [Cellvibrionaceae bacterium]|jgi:hypothetical protein
MNDYALARLLHNEYQTTYSNPNSRDNVKGLTKFSTASIMVALPVAFYAIASFLF